MDKINKIHVLEKSWVFARKFFHPSVICIFAQDSLVLKSQIK